MNIRLLQTASSAAMFSTLDDGNIVRGLGGVPNEGPVLLVGYHMLLGLELSSLVEAFLREKNIMVRGMAHPMLFTGGLELSSTEFSITDWMKVMGAVPVTASNIYKLLSTNSHVLLYPGGVREAFHYRVCQVPLLISSFSVRLKSYILVVIFLFLSSNICFVSLFQMIG